MSGNPGTPSPPADITWSPVTPPVDSGFWGKQATPSMAWTVTVPPTDSGFWGKQTVPTMVWTVTVIPVDNGFWLPVVGDLLDINFILDESRLGGNML